MIVGITGGIGSGKSTLSERFRNAGFPVYDTDKAARRLQNEDSVLREQIIGVFGPESYTGRELNRKYVASLVFEKPELLSRLNELVHPAVRNDFQIWAARHSDSQLLFLECAILFEGGFNRFTNKIIVVSASEDERIARVVRRDGLTPDQVKSRMKNQLPDSEMRSKADLIVDTGITEIRDLDIDKIVQQLLAGN